MIQIYLRENTDFTNNGDMTLFPEECTLKACLNGTWKITMTHSLDAENRWKYIEPEAVLAVPTFMGAKQLFRLSDKIEKNDYEISVTAYPIFWDSADEHMLVDVRPTGKTGQQALDIMTNGTKYSGKSNITAVNTSYFIRRNLLDAINGEDVPTFIKTWGGEMLFNNYEVIINDRVGGDYGYEVRYGKNMESVRHSIDMSNVITRIFPVAYNGHTLSSSYVDSPLINKYVKVYAREIVFSDVKMRIDVNENDEENGIIICDNQAELDAALMLKCNEQFATGVDLMKVTISVDMIDLSSTEEYKDFTDLEKVSLGDTVRCYNNRLGIATEQRVIEIEWDCIEDRVKSVVLGDYETTFIDRTTSIVNRVESTITKDGQVMAERVQGILDGIKTQLKIQSTAAQKQEARVILFEDLDPESPLYGAMALGTQGLQISNKHTTDGRDWEWSTAFTAKGGYADAIITGLLSDKTGRNWWNLDTGEFQLEKYPTDDDVAVLFAISENGIMSSVEKLYETKNSAESNYASFRSSITQNATSITSEVTRAKGVEETLYSKITQNANSISTKVTQGDVCSEINQSAEQIVLKGNRVVVESDKWKVNADGSQECSDMNITGGSVKVNAGTDTTKLVVGIYGRNDYTGTDFNTELKASGLYFKSATGRFVTLVSQGLSGGTYSGNTYYEESYFDLINGKFWAVGNSYCGNLSVGDSLSVSGTKSRKVTTQNYGERLLYCYETPMPLFGDIGVGQLDETGKCYIFLEDLFGETIDVDCVYQVFLQSYGKGECYVSERNASYFIVEGTPELSFAWELKAVQKGYDTMRLEEFEESELAKDTITENEAYLNSLTNGESTLQENEAYLEALVYVGESEDDI